MDFLLLGGGVATLAVSGIAHLLSHLGDDLGAMDSVSYHEFAARSRTGDLILTSNPSVLTISRVVTRSGWSHCGILVKDEASGKFFEWSAHSSDEEVLNSRGTRGFGGAQLVPLEYLASDNGTVFWRPVPGMGEREREKLTKAIEALAYQVKFPDGAEFAAFLGGPFSSALNDLGEGMACSQLVALSYMAAGAIASDRNISQFSPSSFSAEEGDAAWLVTPSARAYMLSGFDTSGLLTIF